MTGLSSPRTRVINALNGAGVPAATREMVLAAVSTLEHDVRLADLRTEGAVAGREHAEREADECSTRADELAEVLEAVERVLHAGRHAQVARRALSMIERDRAARKAS